MGHFQVLLVSLVVVFITGAQSFTTGLPHKNNNDVVMHDMIKNINDRLDRWDALFINQFGPKMIEGATSLAALDANVKNLQERAHVWDTFQLHVSAWNEQLAVLHQKVNKINEQLLASTKPISFDKELYNIETVCKNHSYLARDMLKAIEKKLDNLKLAEKSGHNDAEWMTKPQTFANSHDISEIKGKLDLILGNVAPVYELVDDKEIRHLRKACHTLATPFKKMQRGMEHIRNLANELFEEHRGEITKLDLRRPRKIRGFDEVKDILEDVEQSVKALGRHQERNVNENERILRRLERKIDDLLDDDDKLEAAFRQVLNKVERRLIKAIEDDSDESNKKDKNDSDDDHDSDSSNDSDDDTNESDDSKDQSRKNRKRDDDSSHDSDNDTNESDDSKEKPRKGKKRNDKKSEDSDDDTNESDESKEQSRKSKKSYDNSRDNSTGEDTREDH